MGAGRTRARTAVTLEGELGAALFTRTPRGVNLLPAGRALLEHARAILREVDRTHDVVRARGGA